MKQSELKANTFNRRQAQENTISFGFTTEVKEVAPDFSANLKAKQCKTKAKRNYFRHWKPFNGPEKK